MNKRGVATEAPSAFGGVVIEVLVLILILYVAFVFLKEGLFPKDKQISFQNFNALVMKIETLITEPAEFAAGEFSLTLEAEPNNKLMKIEIKVDDRIIFYEDEIHESEFKDRWLRGSKNQIN